MARVPRPSFSDPQNELDFFNLEDEGSVKGRSLLQKEKISCSKPILGMDGVGKGFFSYLWYTKELGVVLQSRIIIVYIHSKKKYEI